MCDSRISLESFRVCIPQELASRKLQTSRRNHEIKAVFDVDVLYVETGSGCRHQSTKGLFNGAYETSHEQYETVHRIQPSRKGRYFLY